MKVKVVTPKKKRFVLKVNQKELDVIATLVGQCNAFPIEVQHIYDALEGAGANGFKYIVKDEDRKVGTLYLEERTA